MFENKKRRKKRIGIIERTLEGTGPINLGKKYAVQYEVEEVSASAGYSRIRILNVRGISKDLHETAKDLQPLWVVADTVQWMDDGSES
jgi:hypothetical protein